MSKIYFALRDAVLKSPASRFALLDALAAFDKLDPNDALHDAATLHWLMKKRCERLGAVYRDDGLNEIGRQFIGDGDGA